MSAADSSFQLQTNTFKLGNPTTRIIINGHDIALPVAPRAASNGSQVGNAATVFMPTAPKQTPSSWTPSPYSQAPVKAPDHDDSAEKEQIPFQNQQDASLINVQEERVSLPTPSRHIYYTGEGNLCKDSRRPL